MGDIEILKEIRDYFLQKADALDFLIKKMDKIEIFKAMRDDFLKKADALDSLIKKMENTHDGEQYVKAKSKRRIGNTSFNVESFTKYSEIDDGGVFMTEDEFDGVL